jgi:hypothetical protein
MREVNKMEIKKYVLLDDKRIVEICGKTKFGYEYVESKTESGIVITRTLLEDKIVKTSDNILDLVEVGDMLLRSDDFLYHIIVTDITEDTFYGEYEHIWRGNRISHLWKHQLNGDYKKYEVE